MKDAIIIAICAVILGGVGFGVGYATTSDPTPQISAAEQAKLDALPAEAKAKIDESAKKSDSGLKTHNGLVYGGIGAVVGVAAGAGVSAMMGKKK